MSFFRKDSEEDRRESTKLVNDFEELMHRDSLPLALDAGSNEVSDHVLQKFYVCQECYLVSHDVSASGHSTYVTELSRGGHTFPSAHFSEFVAQSFAILNAASNLIRRSSIPKRKAAINLLGAMDRLQILCMTHQMKCIKKLDRMLANIFFNSRRKWVSESVLKD